jgi:hypothetical protein
MSILIAQPLLMAVGASLAPLVTALLALALALLTVHMGRRAEQDDDLARQKAQRHEDADTYWQRQSRREP